MIKLRTLWLIMACILASSSTFANDGLAVYIFGLVGISSTFGGLVIGAITLHRKLPVPVAFGTAALLSPILTMLFLWLLLGGNFKSTYGAVVFAGGLAVPAAFGFALSYVASKIFRR